MASPSELTLDCKPHHTHSLLLMKCFSDQTITPPPNPCAPHHHDHHQQQPQKLEEFLSRLEEERLKIDAFKRELPLCMQLLTNAMETSRQQLQAYRGTGTHEHQPSSVVLEEFIPMKNSSAALPPPPSEDIINKTDNKANWMTTAQLWSQETKPQVSKDDTQTHDNQANTTTMMGFNVRLESPKQRDSLGGGGGGGGFLPFSKERGMPTLALAAAVGSTEMNDKDYHEDEKKKKKSSDNSYDNDVNDHGFSRRGGGSDGQVVVGAVESNNNGANGNLNNNNNNNNNNSSSNTSSQTHRKARRCWSPDLHRRFVNALQMLGGSQVATPKQIRELMKVDGLTNDEVKSHLQKYRLHTRRPSPSPQAPGGQPPQLVVLGGIWVPPEYAAAAAAAHGGQPTLYGATTHAPPPHFCAAPNSVPQDHYYGGMAPMHAAVPAPPHHHHHHRHHAAVHHHQVHVYKTASSQGHSSGPESDDRAAGRERSESIEDGKSDSSSWKAGESGENNGATAAGKGLAALRENGEECDRSEITLKF